MTGPVFITGGSGLLALNWALAIRQTRAVTLAMHTRDVAISGVAKQRCNLGSVETLTRELDALKPEIVIHTAGLTNVDECETKPDMAWQVNVNLATNVALACAKLELPMVHISTDHLFSGDAPFANEEQPTAPKNVYGKTKAEAECRILDAHPQALAIRTNFYGWGTSYRHSFSDFIIGALRSNRPVTLFQDVFYTPILIEVLCQAVHDLIIQKANGIYNVVGDERVSKYVFGLKIAEKFNLDKSLIKPGLLSDETLLVQRPYDMSLSNKKICKLLHRKLGNADEHIKKLYEQEVSGLAKEMGKL